MKINAFSLFEKYQVYNERGNKLKRLMAAIKDDKSLEDCIPMLKEMQKECSDGVSKIKEKLESVEMELDI